MLTRFARPMVSVGVVLVGMVATGLAAAPWLRSFSADAALVPLCGAAVLSVLLPAVVGGSRGRGKAGPVKAAAVRAVASLLAWSAYVLLVVLHASTDVSALGDGLLRGPSRVLTYALPLVTPRSLLVAPVTLTWLVGALTGEAAARSRRTGVPSVALLVAFGLAYAGTERAVDSGIAGGRVQDTVLAAALLACLLVLRAAAGFLRQRAGRAGGPGETDSGADAPGVRALAGGLTLAVALAAVSAIAVQSGAFRGRAAAPERVPRLNASSSLSPLAFVAGLRPTTGKRVRPVFTVTLDRPANGYFALANVDRYDGAGWSFDRTFRPSGGVVPDDSDPALRGGTVVRQDYTVPAGALSGAPWLPTLSRARTVTGLSVSIDATSAMVVPTNPLQGSARYSAESAVPPRTFADLPRTATPDTTTPAVDVTYPPQLSATLARIVRGFERRTSVSSTRPVPFLQAVARTLRGNYGLSPAAAGSATAPVGATASASSPPAGPNSSAGSPAFSDVIGSILGPDRDGTPEQFATLTAMIARSLGVPARVVTGFRVAGADRGPAPRTLHVTTADAWTWVEVPVADAGWVVLDDSPGRLAARSTPSPPPPAASSSSSAVPTQRALITTGANGHAVAHHSSVPAPPPRAARRSLLLPVLTGAGGVLVAALLVLLLRKPARRARRRRAADARARLLGARRESLDVLVEAGLSHVDPLTSAEIAARTADRFGAAPAERLTAVARAADEAVYRSVAVLDPETADVAWDEVRQLRRDLRRQLSLSDRIRATLRYSRSGRTPRRRH